jgi:peptide subunit release factor 1 (eRF1)
MSQQPQGNEAEKNIEIWKVKKLIKRLEAARGNGTSMISLIIRMCASAFAWPDKARLTMCSPQGPGLARRQDVG